MTKKPPAQPFIPGSFADYQRQNLDNSERAPGMQCPPGSLQPVGGGGMPTGAARPINDDTLAEIGSYRVNLAGGYLHSLITPETVTMMERTWRKNAVEGVFTAAPNRPFRLELGTFVVPPQMSFVLLDYRTSIYAPTAIPGDTEELDNRRLSTQMGWDITFSGKRPHNIQHELEPSDPEALNTQFAAQPNPGIITESAQGLGQSPDPSIFDDLAANNYGNSAGTGLSTLPQRKRRDSQLQMPFTYVSGPNQRITISAVVFRALAFPISFFEAEMVGFVIGTNALHEFLKAARTSNKTS